MRVLSRLASIGAASCLAAVLVVWPGFEPSAAACDVSVNTGLDGFAAVKMSGGAGCPADEEGDPKAGLQPWRGSGGGGGSVPQGPSLDELNAKVKAAYASYQRKGASKHGDAQAAGQNWLDALGCGGTFDTAATYVDLNVPCWTGGGDSSGGGAPVKPKLTRQQAWTQVKASMHLEAATPRVGPDYSVHHTRSEVTGKPLDSVVGYPLWFWAEGGDLSSKSSSKSLDGMKVSFSMTPGSVSIDAGDGHSFTCNNLGTAWTSQVEAGTKSPTCGYTYSKVGTYTVSMTTQWKVHYEVDDGKGDPLIGDETLSGTKTRQMRIGELQVLIVNH